MDSPDSVTLCVRENRYMANLDFCYQRETGLKRDFIQEIPCASLIQFILSVTENASSTYLRVKSTIKRKRRVIEVFKAGRNRQKPGCDK